MYLLMIRGMYFPQKNSYDACIYCRKDGPLPAEEVVQEFLKTALRFDESMGIIKYCLSIMLKSLAKRDSAITITQSSVSANSLRELRYST